MPKTEYNVFFDKYDQTDIFYTFKIHLFGRSFNTLFRHFGRFFIIKV